MQQFADSLLNGGPLEGLPTEVGYALASADFSKEELLRIATLVYKQFES